MEQEIRVIYVGGYLIGDHSATGNTLLHLIQGIKNINLVQLFPDYHYNDYCQGKYPVISIDKRKSFLFYLIKEPYYQFIKKRAISQRSVSSHKPNPLLVSLKGILDLLPKFYRQRDYDAIKRFSPQLVYTLAENISVLRITLDISKKYNIPIVVHPMDNIEDSLYTNSLTGTGMRKLYLQLLEKTYSRTSINLAISPKMAESWSKRHSKEFVFAMNCIESLHHSPLPFNLPLRILFSGGIHGGRLESLRIIGELLETEDFKNKFKLYVYTSEAEIQEAVSVLSSDIIVLPFVPKTDYFKNLTSADILLHVESFDKEEVEYFRYSLSTKIPEYLSTGRPIIGFGPSEIGTIDYLESNKAGMAAHSIHDLIEILRMIVSDSSILSEYGKRSIEFAEEHLSTKVSNRVKYVFNESIVRWKGQN